MPLTKRHAIVLTISAATVVIACYIFWNAQRGADADRTLSTIGGDLGSVSIEQPIGPNSGAKSAVNRAAKTKIEPMMREPLTDGWFKVNRTGSFRPQGNALDYVRSQIPLSKAGDALATYRIFLTELSCTNSLRDDAPIDGLDTTSLSECESLLTDPEVSGSNWLDIAAEQGSLEARLMYAGSVRHAIGGPEDVLKNPEKVIEWKQRSMAYLEAAASEGSADAISSLSDAYGNGFLTEQDPLREYAYLLASSRVTPSPYVEQLLAAKASRLTSAQRSRASELATNVVNNCCKP